MNSQQVAGKFDQVAGKFKQAAGEAVGNEKLANSGAAEQVKGMAKETWGNAKETAAEIHDRKAVQASDANDTADHNIRDSVVGAARKVRDSINNGLDNIKRDRTS